MLEPKLTLEYFLTEKFTLRTRPTTSSMQPDHHRHHAQRVTSRDRWNASNFHASVGIGFYPLRK